MMRPTTLLFAFLFVVATMAPSVEGLAFVAGIMRSPINPVAAIRTLRRSTPPPPTALTGTTVPSHDESEEAKVKPSAVTVAAFGCDSTVEAYRNEMRSLVYERSLDRIDEFSK